MASSPGNGTADFPTRAALRRLCAAIAYILTQTTQALSELESQTQP